MYVWVCECVFHPFCVCLGSRLDQSVPLTLTSAVAQPWGHPVTWCHLNATARGRTDGHLPSLRQDSTLPAILSSPSPLTPSPSFFLSMSLSHTISQNLFLFQNLVLHSHSQSLSLTHSFTFSTFIGGRELMEKNICHFLHTLNAFSKYIIKKLCSHTQHSSRNAVYKHEQNTHTFTHRMGERQV